MYESFYRTPECKSKNPPISLLANQNAFCPGQFFRISKNPSTSVLGTEFVFCPALFSKFPEYKNSPYFFIRNKNAVLDGKFFNEFSNYCASAKILPLYIRFRAFCKGVFRPTSSIFFRKISEHKKSPYFFISQRISILAEKLFVNFFPSTQDDLHLNIATATESSRVLERSSGSSS